MFKQANSKIHSLFYLHSSQTLKLHLSLANSYFVNYISRFLLHAIPLVTTGDTSFFGLEKKWTGVVINARKSDVWHWCLKRLDKHANNSIEKYNVSLKPLDIFITSSTRHLAEDTHIWADLSCKVVAAFWTRVLVYISCFCFLAFEIHTWWRQWHDRYLAYLPSILVLVCSSCINWLGTDCFSLSVRLFFCIHDKVFTFVIKSQWFFFS